jgi:hypothetical protein
MALAFAFAPIQFRIDHCLGQRCTGLTVMFALNCETVGRFPTGLGVPGAVERAVASSIGTVGGRLAPRRTVCAEFFAPNFAATLLQLAENPDDVIAA